MKSVNNQAARMKERCRSIQDARMEGPAMSRACLDNDHSFRFATRDGLASN